MQLCVLDGGAVRLKFPSTWIVKQQPDSVQIHDSEPPNDSCVLAVSRFQAPDLPLAELLSAALAGDERNIIESGETVEIVGSDLAIAWKQVTYREPEENREALSRLAIGRGSSVNCMITFDFWADQAEKFSPIWDQILASLVLGKYKS